MYFSSLKGVHINGTIPYESKMAYVCGSKHCGICFMSKFQLGVVTDILITNALTLVSAQGKDMSAATQRAQSPEASSVKL